jgi:hypothetical protein
MRDIPRDIRSVIWPSRRGPERGDFDDSRARLDRVDSIRRYTRSRWLHSPRHHSPSPGPEDIERHVKARNASGVPVTATMASVSYRLRGSLPDSMREIRV